MIWGSKRLYRHHHSDGTDICFVDFRLARHLQQLKADNRFGVYFERTGRKAFFSLAPIPVTLMREAGGAREDAAELREN